MKNALVILAGGKGRRFGKKTPKQFYKIGNSTIINTFFDNLEIKYFDIIVVSIEKKYRSIIKNYYKKFNNKKKFIFSEPGKSRQKSSYNSLKKINSHKIKNVLIHDAARPFCSNKLISKILNKLKKSNNAIPYIEYNDRQITKLKKEEKKVLNIQTPQGFHYDMIYNAHKKLINKQYNDDSALMQELDFKINLVKGEKTNIKITYPEDLVYLNLFKKPILKSGIGYDIHQIDKKTKKGLKLCGVNLPFSKLIGHSDADVGLHAICDSIFGALSMRDIGYHFPNNKKKWKNADSSLFVIYCRKKLSEKGFSITNLDINIIAEKPKINKFVRQMKIKISKLLLINTNCISIKATTNEKIGFIGNGEGIAAEAIVQISNENYN
tara:strand:+ start:440 stop:1579 length:1140 start_codon:yes stop_codon:yes gene_type:complete